MLLSYLLQFLKLQRYRAQNRPKRIGSPHTQAPKIATSTCVPNFEEYPQLDHIGLSWDGCARSPVLGSVSVSGLIHAHA